MSTGIHEDRKPLFDSAVSFLSDPSVKDAPLTKKIEFLQSKGLTQQEVEVALKESQKDSQDHSRNDGNNSRSASFSEPIRDSMVYEAVPPPLPRRDWKDYFIMATATAGLFYGVYEVTKRYVIPNILPESQSKLDQDKKEIRNQFDKVDKLLERLENEQSEFKKQEEQKLSDLDKTVVDLQTCLEQTSHTRNRIEDEFKMMKLEMANLQSKLDTFVMSKKGDQHLEKINSEFESLKNLIKNRELASANLATDGSTNGPNRTSPSNKSPVPGVEAIPSAAEILSKMNFGNGGNNTNEDQNQASIPAWKKAREESLSRSKPNSSSNSIPEWQKSSSNSVEFHDLQDPANDRNESMAQE